MTVYCVYCVRVDWKAWFISAPQREERKKRSKTACTIMNYTKTMFSAFTDEAGNGHLCLISLNLFLSLPVGVAGMDRQNQWETGEKHQTAGSGGKTRKCSWRECPHLLQVDTYKRVIHRKFPENPSLTFSILKINPRMAIEESKVHGTCLSLLTPSGTSWSSLPECVWTVSIWP